MREEITYISDDGKAFVFKKECEAHEKWLKTREGELLNPVALKKKMQFFDSVGRKIKDPKNDWNHVIFISVHENDPDLFNIINAIDTKFMGYSHRNPFSDEERIFAPSLLHYNGYKWEDYNDEINRIKSHLECDQKQLDQRLEIKERILKRCDYCETSEYTKS